MIMQTLERKLPTADVNSPEVVLDARVQKLAEEYAWVKAALADHTRRKHIPVDVGTVADVKAFLFNK